MFVCMCWICFQCMVGVKRVETRCICSTCFQCVLNMFWKCFQCVWWGSKLNHTFFRRRNAVRKRRTDWKPCLLCCFSLKQMQEGNWAKKTSFSKSDKHIEHSPCNEAAEVLKPRQIIRNHASTKSNPTVILLMFWLGPQTKVSPQSNCSGMTFEGVFEPSF